MKTQAIVINEKDNVATLVDTVPSGGQIQFMLGPSMHELQLRQSIPVGHKCAICPIGLGEGIVKYGENIGSATVAIQPGDYVHTHNLESRRGRGDLNQQ